LLTIIDPQEIFLQRIIGEGTFGRVWSAKWRSAGVAVKEFVFAQAAVAGKSLMQQEIVEEIIGEAGMMAILRHPNVLQLFGCSLTAQAIWIVSELCSLGSLRQLLDDNERSLPVEIRVSLALQVAEGMTYLHNQDPPIIHRDLKSHNIFVHETFTNADDSDQKKKGGGEVKDKAAVGQLSRWLQPVKMKPKSTLVAKIGDWGSARATMSGSRTMTHGVGTACWLAPEVIKHARSSKLSDVYGYGIVLWELATREEVYQGLETTQIIAKVANESLRPPVPQDCPWKDLMVKCWEEKPTDRLEFNEIVAELNKTSKELVTQRKMREAVIASQEARLIEANASATAIDRQQPLRPRVTSVSRQMRYCLTDRQSLTSRCETSRQFC
jgi:serine/threonine protein kinase